MSRVLISFTILLFFFSKQAYGELSIPIDYSSDKTPTYNDKEELHWGLGIGHYFTGIGANLAITDINSAKSVSIGCESITYSDTFGTSTNCGIGFAYVTTKIIKDDRHHGLGVYLHITENNIRHSSKTESVLGVGYNYYTNGINSEGWNFGTGINLLSANKNDSNSIFLSLGYQF